MAPRIVHVTPIRSPFEPRTRFQCESAAKAGFEVALVAPAERDDEAAGVQLLAVPPPRSRLDRITRTALRVVRRALAWRPDLVTFHDPEFILWGLVFRVRGIPTVYDVHEDYAAAMAVRFWLPRPLRPLASWAMRALAALARRLYPVVIAERYYARIFPGAVEVLNYARLEELAPLMARPLEPPARIRLLYTGSIGRERGALHALRLLDRLPADAELRFVGYCPSRELARTLRTRAARDPRLQLVIDDERWVPRDAILAAYAEPWTATVALFPDSDHYRETEPTKFFESMAAGIPILCSDFPTWKALVADQRVGLVVDPEDPAAAAAAVHRLHRDPELARAMGARGRELVRRRYNWESQAERLVALYHELLGGRMLPDPARAPGSGG